MARGKIEKRGQRHRKVKPVILIVTEGSQINHLEPIMGKYIWNRDFFRTRFRRFQKKRFRSLHLQIKIIGKIRLQSSSTDPAFAWS